MDAYAHLHPHHHLFSSEAAAENAPTRGAGRLTGRQGPIVKDLDQCVSDLLEASKC